jgi:hypothetical protein
VVAGNASVLVSMAEIRLPIESHPLQAFVSESMKPVLDTVIMSNAVHCYVSQSDKGELVIGAGIDAYNGYGQRGSFHTIEHAMAAIIELFPMFSRVRMLRMWGGIVDVCPDACPIISKTPIDGLYFNCGWGTGGFKATPGSGWVFAHTIAQDRPHQLNVPFDLQPAMLATRWLKPTDEASDTVEEVADDAVEEVADDAVEDATDAAGDMADEAAEVVDDVVDDESEAISDAIDDAEDAADDTGGDGA